MLVPVQWMKEYVNIEADVKELVERITLSGSHVDSLNAADHGIEGIVVGHITRIEKHPNADKLVVCTIDVGEEELTIVTAAKNVFEGAYVPVSTVGAVLGDGTKIGSHDFMGILSQGMLCSHEELGFEDNVIPKLHRDGILILPEEVKPGTDIRDVLGMRDHVIEFEITPNRSDCTSILGMAREVAATFDLPYHEPDHLPMAADADEIDLGENRIDTDRCSRLYTRVMTNVIIQESPLWLQNYLMKAGMRPINNIVDITNYVMLEYGQPLHAYDLDKLQGHRLIVRQAKSGEKLKCIDAVTRELTPEDMIIADDSGPIGIAGVMGGFDTEVTEGTKAILLESAAFDKDSIRRTVKRLGLRSEASSRFEKGITPVFCENAADRACFLAEEIGAASISDKVGDIGLGLPDPIQIRMRYDRCNALLGTELSKNEMISLLERLDLEVTDEGAAALVQVPHFRRDLEIEADLIEEVGRLFGFHNIQPKKLVGELIEGELSKERIVENILRSQLFALGYLEALTYSFISPKANEKARIPEGLGFYDYVKLLNPLGEEYSVMRTTLLPNMLDILGKNVSYRAEEIRVYELGNIFEKAPEGELPGQRRRLALGAYGNMDFYQLKAQIQSILHSIGIGSATYRANKEHPSYHAGRCADILLGDVVIGTFGEVSHKVVDNYDLNKRSYLCELNVDEMVAHADLEKSYKKIHRYPSIVRDMALIVDRSVTAAQIEGTIHSVNADILSEVRLFDVYMGDQIPAGKKSMAYQVVYQAADRTLVDAEVNALQERILAMLNQEFDTELRS